MATFVEWHCLALGCPFPSFFAWMGFSKQTSSLVELPFLTMSLLSWSACAVIGQEPWLLRTGYGLRRWLEGQLGEVLSDQHKGTRNVVGLRDPISLKWHLENLIQWLILPSQHSSSVGVATPAFPSPFFGHSYVYINTGRTVPMNVEVTKLICHHCVEAWDSGQVREAQQLPQPKQNENSSGRTIWTQESAKYLYSYMLASGGTDLTLSFR